MYHKPLLVCTGHEGAATLSQPRLVQVAVRYEARDLFEDIVNGILEAHYRQRVGEIERQEEEAFSELLELRHGHVDTAKEEEEEE